MAKTYFNEQQIKKWFVDGREVKKAYFNNQLVFSSVFELVISSSNHNVPANWIWTLLPPEQQQAQSNTIKIIVNQGVKLVTASTALSGVFDFSGSWAGKTVIIENHGFILGRGGNGGNEGKSGGAGGKAVYHNNTLVSLSINNQGVIGGGGGGGGGNRPGDSCGGGGGAPFGAGGWGSYSGVAQSATFDTPGAGGGNNLANPGAGQTRWGGNGGRWGLNGSPGMDFSSKTTNGGSAGEATRGTITWINRGDIRGATV